MVKPIERVLHSGLFGPWDRPDIKGILPDELPPAVNPARHKSWGTGLVRVLPELHAAVLGAGLVPHLPLLADRSGQAHLRVHASTSFRRRTPVSGWPRNSPR